MYRALISPVIGLCVVHFISVMVAHKGFLWVTIYLIASSVSLIPTPLLELRYFTPGVMFAVLNAPVLYTGEKEVQQRTYNNYEQIHMSSNANDLLRFMTIQPPAICYAVTSALTIIGLVTLNSIAIYIYLYRSFQWPDGSIARFMY